MNVSLLNDQTAPDYYEDTSYYHDVLCKVNKIFSGGGLCGVGLAEISGGTIK